MRASTLDRKFVHPLEDRLYFKRQRLANEEYHSVKSAVSSSALKELYKRKNPQYCYQKYIKGTIQNNPSPAMIFGSALHKYVLELRLFDKEFAVWEGGRKAGQDWKDFKELHQDKDIISKEDMDKIKAMKKAVYANEKARELLKGGEAEKSVFWRDEETGVLCKARADYIKEVNGQRVIVDLKTCKTAEPEQFAKDIIQYAYPVQQAMYLDGFKASSFAFISVEKEPPYTVQVYRLDPFFDNCGHFVYRQMLEQWGGYLESKEWPSYGSGIMELQCPEWYHNKTLGG